jgi:hypothetical protein
MPTELGPEEKPIETPIDTKDPLPEEPKPKTELEIKLSSVTKWEYEERTTKTVEITGVDEVNCMIRWDTPSKDWLAVIDLGITQPARLLGKAIEAGVVTQLEIDALLTTLRKLRDEAMVSLGAVAK